MWIFFTESSEKTPFFLIIVDMGELVDFFSLRFYGKLEIGWSVGVEYFVFDGRYIVHLTYVKEKALRAVGIKKKESSHDFGLQLIDVVPIFEENIGSRTVFGALKNYSSLRDCMF